MNKNDVEALSFGLAKAKTHNRRSGSFGWLAVELKNDEKRAGKKNETMYNL